MMKKVAFAGLLNTDPVIDSQLKIEHKRDFLVYFDLTVNSISDDIECIKKIRCQVRDNAAEKFYRHAKKGDLVEIKGVVETDLFQDVHNQYENFYVKVEGFRIYVAEDYQKITAN